MNERLRELRKSLGITLEEFGNRVGVTKTAISRLEKGERSITEQMLKSICREFDVDEHWLRTGEGEMHVSLSKKEQVARVVGRMLRNDDEFIQNAFITLGNLTPEEWAVAKKIVYGFMGEQDQQP